MKVTLEVGKEKNPAVEILQKGKARVDLSKAKDGEKIPVFGVVVDLNLGDVKHLVVDWGISFQDVSFMGLDTLDYCTGFDPAADNLYHLKNIAFDGEIGEIIFMLGKFPKKNWSLTLSTPKTDADSMVEFIEQALVPFAACSNLSFQATEDSPTIFKSTIAYLKELIETKEAPKRRRVVSD